MNTAEVVVQEVPEKKRSFKKVILMFGAVITSIFASVFSASAATPGVVMPLQASDQGIENLGTLFTTITGWLTSIVSTITSSPLLLLGLGIFVVGAVIGLAYRLIRG